MEDQKPKGAMARQRDRYLAMGLVQINAWVPADEKYALLRYCASLRRRHVIKYERREREREQ